MKTQDVRTYEWTGSGKPNMFLINFDGSWKEDDLDGGAGVVIHGASSLCGEGKPHWSCRAQIGIYTKCFSSHDSEMFAMTTAVFAVIQIITHGQIKLTNHGVLFTLPCQGFYKDNHQEKSQPTTMLCRTNADNE